MEENKKIIIECHGPDAEGINIYLSSQKIEQNYKGFVSCFKSEVICPKGTHILRFEQKRMYKSRYCWIFMFFNLFMAPFGYSLDDMLYAEWCGMINVSENTMICCVLKKNEGRYCFDISGKEIKCESNRYYVDAKNKKRYKKYIFIPLCIIMILFEGLLIGILNNAINSKNTIAIIISLIFMLLCFGALCFLIVRINRLISKLSKD